MIQQRHATGHLAELSRYFPVVAITGPRQSGKTTLARQAAANKPYVSLENPDVRLAASSDPRGFLRQYPGGAVIDEVQRFPDLLSYLQQIVDEEPEPGKWLLTGSRQFGLRSGITQSLAGRAGLLHLLPFAAYEWYGDNPPALDQLLWSGLYPPLLDRNIPAGIFMPQYVATYVERDVREILELRDIGLFSRFVRLCAGRAGQLLNLTSLANDVSVSHHTVRSWIDVLEASYLVFRLPPWHVNLTKRLVKTPKLFFYDTGLLCWLLGISSAQQLSTHALRGAIFENWVIIEVLKAMYNQGTTPEVYFFRDHSGNEVDLLITIDGMTHAIEIKSGETLNASYFDGLDKLEQLAKTACQTRHLVYAGNEALTRHNVQVHGWKGLAQAPLKVLTAAPATQSTTPT
jgi:uncharacterized protein